jgi:hypothetical protein
MTPPVLFGLTSLGIFHTIISIIALFAGLYAFATDGKISWASMSGKIYIISTIVVCITGFGIFQHGGFGKAHQLGIITLVTFAIAFAAGSKTRLFGKASPYVETIGFSLTFFFNIVPTITEATTRLPLGAPIYSSPEDPHIGMFIGACFVLFLIGVIYQIRKLRVAAQV